MRSAVEIGTKEDIANASIALAWHSLNLGAVIKWKHHKEGQSRGGGAEKAAWHDYVRQQVADFYTISPRKPATEITTSIMKNAPPEIDLPEYDAVYEFVREVRKGLKQSPAQK
jgi:hypothetical protein